MKSTMRGLVFGLASLGALSFIGCSEGNDTAVIQATNSGGQKAKVAPDAPNAAGYNDMMQHQPENPTAKGYGMQQQGGGGAGGRK